MRAAAALFLLALTIAPPSPSTAQVGQDAQPRFRATVDVVTIAAVVRDKQGRFVSALTKDDFTILDNGQKRPIVEFQPDDNGPISIGLLVDGSGSMRHFSSICRRVGELLLTQLNDHSDDVSLMSFDSRLVHLREFTSDFQQFRSGLAEVENWGASSIYDAIAGAAHAVAQHTRKRRAVVVVTDGYDNWSTLPPAEVARIASTIDVPVFVLSVTPPTAENTEPVPGGGELGDIARATGGEYFQADTETRQARALGRVAAELRHQYLIAIDPAKSGGRLRTLEIRTRNPSLKVRARQWYAANDDE
jgi:Ca-activated chloride channel family protein